MMLPDRDPDGLCNAPFTGHGWYMRARTSTTLSFLVCLVVFIPVVVSLSPRVAEAQSPVPPVTSPQAQSYDEKEAQGIDRMLMCPVCPAETIDQAQVEISRQMRRVVRTMLAQGASRQEILDFFTARYGTKVLAAPPKSGLNLLAWLVPVAGVLAAAGAGLLVIRSMAGRGGAGTGDAPVDEPVMEAELAEYLELIDRDLSLSGAGVDRALAGEAEAVLGATDAEPVDSQSKDIY